jgi:hypothetical protein
MPFKSQAQARYLFASHPEIARRWARVTASIKSLPNKVKKKSKRARRRKM